MAKHILKVTDGDCAVKIYGADGVSETISLATDLLTSHEILTPTKSQVVNITGVTWTGDSPAVITIKRNNVVIMTCQAQTTSQFDFSGQGAVPDNVENTHDLVVSISGAQSECWIRLQKISGYSSKIETSIFSQYDNETAVGS